MIIDIVVIAFVVLSIFLGYKKGLISLAMGIIALVLSLVVTFFLYQPIANLVINTTNIDESMQDTLYNQADEMMRNEEDESAEEQELTEDIKDQAIKGVLPETAKALSITIVQIGVFLVLLIGLRIGLMFIKSLAEAIGKLPLLKQINNGGGAVYGLIRGLLIVYIFLAIVGIATQIDSKNAVYKEINSSTITKVMYDNNIVNIFF